MNQLLQEAERERTRAYRWIDRLAAFNRRDQRIDFLGREIMGPAGEIEQGAQARLVAVGRLCLVRPFSISVRLQTQLTGSRAAVQAGGCWADTAFVTFFFDLRFYIVSDRFVYH